MKKTKITISDNGVITVPSVSDVSSGQTQQTAPVLMRDFEIAELFGVYCQTIKANIRAILKSGVVAPDYTHGGTVIGNTIRPDYFGLDIITALAFRIHSKQTEIFRKWIMSKVSAKETQFPKTVLVQINRQALTD